MLRRTATGPFSESQCIALDELEALGEAERIEQLLPVQSLLQDHEKVMLDADNSARFLSGMRRRGPWPELERAAVFGPAEGSSTSVNNLLGTGHVRAGELIPGRLLSPIEIQQILEPAS